MWAGCAGRGEVTPVLNWCRTLVLVILAANQLENKGKNSVGMVYSSEKHRFLHRIALFIERSPTHARARTVTGPKFRALGSPATPMQCRFVPNPIRTPEIRSFLEAHTHALVWQLGMLNAWPHLDPESTQVWRFLEVRSQGTLEAVLACDLSRRWWGLTHRTIPGAIEGVRFLLKTGFPFSIEGEDTALEAVLEALPALKGRLAHDGRCLTLRRHCGAGGWPRPGGFRPGTLEDLPLLLAYFHQEPTVGPPASIPLLNSQLQEGIWYVLEVSRRGVCLGAAADAGPYRYIRDVYTFPELRRQGWARQWMEGILSILHDSAQDAVLCVAEDNRPAITLYHSMGFEPWGRRRNLHFHRRRPSSSFQV